MSIDNDTWLKFDNSSGVAFNTIKVNSSNELQFNTPGGETHFFSNGTKLFTIDDSVPNMVLSNSTGAEQSAHLFVGTSDGSDHMSISMAAAGEQGTARSGLVTCYGNEFTTSSRGGECRVIGGAVSGGHVAMEANHVDADVILKSQGGWWTVDSTDGNLESDTASAGIVLRSPDDSCSLCTVDNSDVFSCTSVTC